MSESIRDKFPANGSIRISRYNKHTKFQVPTTYDSAPVKCIQMKRRIRKQVFQLISKSSQLSDILFGIR